MIYQSMETFYMPEGHTGSNIAEAKKGVVQDWNLTGTMLCSITTGNGTNIVLAASLLRFLRIFCFGHCLHLALLAAVDNPQITRLLAKCRKLTPVFSWWWKKQLKLTGKQQELHIPMPKLLWHCKTRWSSTYKLLLHVDKNKEAINNVITDDECTVALEIMCADHILFWDVYVFCLHFTNSLMFWVVRKVLLFCRFSLRWTLFTTTQHSVLCRICVTRSLLWLMRKTRRQWKCRWIELQLLRTLALQFVDW